MGLVVDLFAGGGGARLCECAWCERGGGVMSNISIDELKKMVLKQDFLLDKIMSVCIDAGAAADNFSEHACRELLKDIFKTWCEVSNEHKSSLKVIWELEYEDMVKRNKKEVS